MDTIDKILQQMRAKEHDLSISKDLMAAQSVDQLLQVPVAFPDEKVQFYQGLPSQDTLIKTYKFLL